jgi:hypothetical protein
MPVLPDLRILFTLCKSIQIIWSRLWLAFNLSIVWNWQYQLCDSVINLNYQLRIMASISHFFDIADALFIILSVHVHISENHSILLLRWGGISIYRVSQEERSIFWEGIVLVIVIRSCICTCILFRTVSNIELFHYTVVWIWFPISSFPPDVNHLHRCWICWYAHMSCKVHWCWWWDFQKCITLGKLYQLCHLNNIYRCWKWYVISHSYQQFVNCIVK